MLNVTLYHHGGTKMATRTDESSIMRCTSGICWFHEVSNKSGVLHTTAIDTILYTPHIRVINGEPSAPSAGPAVSTRLVRHAARSRVRLDIQCSL